jgi:POT family proton-dependent oligopeptide transporter
VEQTMSEDPEVHESDQLLHNKDVTVSKTANHGVPLATLFILGMELCERLCYFGATLVLQLYCLDMLGLTNSQADAVNNGFTFWAYLSPLIGGYIADAYWGKYKTILVFGIAYLIGMILLTLSAAPFVWYDFPRTIGTHGIVVFAFAWFFVGLGTGGIKSNVGTLIADQLDDSKAEDIERVYRWFYWCVNIGSIVGMAVTPHLHDVSMTSLNGVTHGTSYWLSFLVPTCCFVLALLIFISASKLYVVKAPEGSLLSKVIAVIKSAWKRRHLPEVAGKPFVLKADISQSSPEFVSQVAQALHICKVFAFFPIYWLLYYQLTSNFITQGQWLDRPFWLAVDQLNLMDPIVIVVMIPVADYTFPLLRRSFGWKLGPLQRISVGFVIAGLVFIYVGTLQYFVDQRGSYYTVGGHIIYTLKPGFSEMVSVWWQLPPFLIIGITEIFSVVSSLEFAYAKAPENMKAVVMALILVTQAGGSALGLVMSPLFIPQNFMAIFFAFSGGMLLLAIIFFKYFKDESFDSFEAQIRVQALE